MSVPVTLATRYIAGRKLRTTLTTLAVAFGVMLVFGLNGVFPGYLGAMNKAMLASAGEVDLAVTSVSGATFESDVTEAVAGVEGVAVAAPSLRRTMALPAEGDYGVSTIVLVGIDPQLAPQVSAYPISEGRFLGANETSGLYSARELVLPVAVAERMGLEVGDAVELPSAAGTTHFELVGIADVATVPGTDEAFVALPAAQEMFALGDRISEVDAAIEAGTDRENVERDVAAAVGPSFDVGGISTDSPMAGGLRMARSVITMFGVFAFAMAGFIIYNTFRTTVAERRHDVGMLRAVGASRRTILGIFLAESLAQGIAGTLLGLLAGWGLALVSMAALNSLMADLLGLPTANVLFAWETWATAIGLGIGVTVLSSLLPARAASRMTPLDALRPVPSTETHEKAVAWRGWIGLVLATASVAGLVSGNMMLVVTSAVGMLVGLTLAAPVAVKPITDVFGRLIENIYRREGWMARSNLQRNPGRAAATASTVLVSVTVVIALLGTIASVFDGFLVYVEESTGADFLVLPHNLLLSGGTVGAGPELVAEIESTEGVGDVATMRVARAAHAGTNVEVVGIDPVAYPKVSSLDFAEGSSHDDLAELSAQNAIMVNGVFSTRTGAKAGDDLELTTPEGNRTFRVVAVGSDYLTAKLPTVYVSQDSLESLWGVTSDVLVMANAAEGADRARSLTALEETVRTYPSFVLYGFDEWRRTQETMLSQLEASMLALAFVLALPSFLALLNTLTMGVLARTREIGMLRAVGSTRKQIRRMIAAESMMLAALGTSVGLLAGIWLGYAMKEAMVMVGFTITTPYVFPWTGIATAVVVTLAFAALAALLPSRQATRLDVVRALRYE
ncbi:MAG: FtsX-like permease family protein [Coriobacteriia bacterium]|nr:FtsX-like permease family protein [Coriobacteriia bacterium]